MVNACLVTMPLPDVPENLKLSLLLPRNVFYSFVLSKLFSVVLNFLLNRLF